MLLTRCTALPQEGLLRQSRAAMQLHVPSAHAHSSSDRKPAGGGGRMQSVTARLAERAKENVSNTQQSAAHDAAGRSTSAGNHGLQVRPHRAAHRHAAATTQAPSCKRQPRWWWRVGGACTGPRCGPQVHPPSITSSCSCQLRPTLHLPLTRPAYYCQTPACRPPGRRPGSLQGRRRQRQRQRRSGSRCGQRSLAGGAHPARL